MAFFMSRKTTHVLRETRTGYLTELVGFA